MIPLSKYKLSRKFVIYIFLLTLIITFFLILINFFIEKEKELKNLDQTFKEISSTHYESLSHSLWMVATSQVTLQLQGIITHPDIIYVEVVSETQKVYKKGENKTEKIKFVEQTLQFNQENVGKIKVVADLDKIENRLIQNTIMLVVNQFLTILILSGGIIFIFYKEVSRHLSDIENYFSSGNILNKPLTIDRNVSIKDELSVVVDSVNNMRKTLNKNITKLQELNENLEEKVIERTKEQASLLSLFDIGDSVLFKWNNDEYWSVAYVSQSIEKLLGYTQEEFVNGSIVYKDCIAKDDLQTLISEVEEETESDNNYLKHKPYRLVTKDGNMKWVLDYTVIFRDDNGKITHYLGYIIDITEQKENEKVIAEQSKLVDMGEMIGNIAHQWRQPLSIISTASTGVLFHKEMGSLNDDILEKEMNMINDHAQYLSKTIDDFRDFIKGEKKFTNVTVKDLLDSTLNIISPTLKSNYIDLNLEIDDSLVFHGSKNELEQVLINIINNSKDAIKANEIENGYICISTNQLDENRFSLDILDNGGGVPEDIISHIFEPYYTTKHQSQGTGLGLSMVDQIVRARHGQSISVKNKEYELNGSNCKGACFSIVFSSIDTTN